MEIKVYCKNSNCQEFGIETSFSWDGQSTTKLMLLRKCTCCGEVREIIPKDKSTETNLENISFGRISSMSPEDRKRELKKRSNKHFKKEIKEYKDYADAAVYGKTK